MSKKSSGKKKTSFIGRTRPTPYSTHSTDDIIEELISEDELGNPELSDLLAALGSQSSAPPRPTPSSSVPYCGTNPLVNSMANMLVSTEFSAFHKHNTLVGWSSLAQRLLSITVDALEDYQHNPSHKDADLALIGIRINMVAAINKIDEMTARIGGLSSSECPRSCPGSREVTPEEDATMANPPPPPLAKSYRDVAAEAGSQIIRPPPPPTNPARHLPKPRAQSKTSKAKAPLPKPPAAAGVPPKPKTPIVTADPIRLVIRFGGNPPEDLRSRPQTDLFRRISNMLDVHPTIKDVSILGAHWNKSGNIIVSFPNGTSRDAILALRPGIRTALGLADSVFMSIDTPWTKLMVSSVLARPQAGASVFSEEDLATSFARNPEIPTLSITRPPRWIRNPDNITGAHSSFVFNFEDPDGSIARRLLKTPLFMFGAPVSIKRWQEKPKPRKPARPAPGPAK